MTSTLILKPWLMTTVLTVLKIVKIVLTNYDFNFNYIYIKYVSGLIKIFNFNSSYYLKNSNI